MVAIQPSQAQSSLTNGLVAYYPFSGNADDASGKGKHGVAANVVATSDRYGVANAAYKFNGTNSYVDLVANRPLTGITAAFTIAGWMRADSIQVGKGIYFHRGNFADIGVRLYQDPNFPLRLEFITYGSSTGGFNTLVANSAIPVSNWVFFAASYDGALKKLFVNGNLVASVSFNGTLDWNSNFMGESIGGTFPGQAEPFDGALDEIRLYDRALSEAEIAELRVFGGFTPSISSQPVSVSTTAGSSVQFSVTAAGTPSLAYQWSRDGAALLGATNATLQFTNVFPKDVGSYSAVVTNFLGSVTSSAAGLTIPGELPGLAAHYPLDGNATEQSGYGKNGTLVNTQPAPDRFGLAGAALRFNGANSYVDLTANRVFANQVAGVSIAGWLRPDTIQPGSGVFFHRVHNADYGVRLSQSLPMRLEFVTLRAGTDLLFSTSSIPVGRWTSFVVTHDGATKKLYINGNLESASTYPGGLNWDPGTGPQETISGIFPGQAESFNGAIDDLRFYSRAVTDQEVVFLFGSIPFISAQPSNVAAIVNGSATFSMVAIGPAPLTYQWRKDGVPLAGATGATLNLSNLQPAQAGNYTVVVTNAYGSVTSSVASLSVSFLTQSITFNALPGKRVDALPFSLGATASSGLAVSYSSSDPAVATINGGIATITGIGSTTITASQPGTATYLPAVSVSRILAVSGIPPSIAVHPAALSIDFSSNASFSVTASGTAPLAYQWRKDDVELPGATGALLSLPNVQFSQAGSYTVVITNVWGSITSSVAVLSVNRLSQTINFGALPVKRVDEAPFALAASASSGLPVSYNSSDLAVANVNGNVVTITGIGSTIITAIQVGNGTYLPAGSVNRTLIVGGIPPSISSPPQGQSFGLGNSLMLSVTAGGSAPLSYQWQFNGTNIPGANSVTLSLANLSATNAGAYRVLVANVAGTTTSTAADVYFYGDLKFIAATVLAGSIGQQYRVDYADVVNIGTTNWLVLTNVALPYSPFLVIDPASSGKSQRYYRAVPLP